MRPIVKVAAAVVLAASLLSVAGAAALTASVTPAAESVVKVKDGAGHGSGVHIGNGYVLTAAHVVRDKKTMTLRVASGAEATAEVLWSNSEYDVALLHTGAPLKGSSHLQCREPEVGEDVSAIGNPIGFEFVSAFGRVSGAAREYKPWKSVMITDMTTVMGQSGGAIFDAKGNVVGIVVGVGVMPLPAGFFLVPSLTGYGIAVPGDVICRLMADGAGWA